MHCKRTDGRLGRALWLTLPLAGLAGGCGWFGGGANGDGRSARPLVADQFVGPGTPSAPDGGRIAGNPVEKGGAVNVDSDQLPARRQPPPASAEPNPGATRLTPAVTETVRGPYRTNGGANGNGPNGSAVATYPAGGSPRADVPPSAPTTTRVDLTTPPTTGPSSAGTGSADPYAAGGPRAVDVGFVVLEVNGKPIYSDKVLQALERPLAAEAKKNTARQFPEVAGKLLQQQLQLFVRDELEVATAERSLDAQDKALAKALTMQWRQQQITAAGGSLEMARRKARDDGWEFEELVQQQYRLKLVQLFYQKRIYPLIQVAASDVRAYYERNRQKEFSTAGRLKFRVVRIDPAKYVSPDEALLAAERVRDQARAGADFAALANEIHGDTRGGAVGTADAGGWVEANSYRYEAVEKAVAKLRPGQVTDVVQEGGTNRLMFVAKLEDIQDAKDQPFEDQAVQERITQRLRGEQLQQLRKQHVDRLSQNAVVRENPGKPADLLAIVFRRYEEWAKAG